MARSRMLLAFRNFGRALELASCLDGQFSKATAATVSLLCALRLAGAPEAIRSATTLDTMSEDYSEPETRGFFLVAQRYSMVAASISITRFGSKRGFSFTPFLAYPRGLQSTRVPLRT